MSAAKRKTTPTPDMGGLTDDWNKLAALRHHEHTHQEPSAPDPQTSTPPPKPEGSDPTPSMTRRSWYAEKNAVAAFAAAVDDLHHTTRAPKYVVVGELFKAAAALAPGLEEKLSRQE